MLPSQVDQFSSQPPPPQGPANNSQKKNKKLRIRTKCEDRVWLLLLRSCQLRFSSGESWLISGQVRLQPNRRKRPAQSRAKLGPRRPSAQQVLLDVAEPGRALPSTSGPPSRAGRPDVPAPVRSAPAVRPRVLKTRRASGGLRARTSQAHLRHRGPCATRHRHRNCAAAGSAAGGQHGAPTRPPRRPTCRGRRPRNGNSPSPG